MGSFAGNEQLAELGKVRKLCPSEQTVAAAFGKHRIERFHTVDGKEVKGEGPDGKYQWRMKFQPNDHGKSTRDNERVKELFKPFWKSDIERHSKNVKAPGEYFGSGYRPTGFGDVCREYCETCDRLLVWCECETRAPAQGSAQGLVGRASTSVEG